MIEHGLRFDFGSLLKCVRRQGLLFDESRLVNANFGEVVRQYLQCRLQRLLLGGLGILGAALVIGRLVRKIEISGLFIARRRVVRLDAIGISFDH